MLDPASISDSLKKVYSLNSGGQEFSICSGVAKK